MFREELEMYLIGQKLLPLKLNIEKYNILYKVEADKVKAVMLYAGKDDMTILEADHQKVRAQVVEFLSGRYQTQINTVTIYCIDDIDVAKNLLDNSTASDERWCVNTRSNTFVNGYNQDIYDMDIYKYVKDVEAAESYRVAYELGNRSVYVKEPTVNDIRRARVEQEGRRLLKKGVLRDYVLTMTTLLIVINFVVHFDLEGVGSTMSPHFMLKYGAMYWENLFDKGEAWRLLTSMFMHFGIDHLIGNMFVLFLLGNALEQAVGKIRFLIIYIGSGIVGGLVSGIYQWSVEGRVVSAGASGAIYGVMGAMIIVFWVCKIRTSISLRGLIVYSVISIVNSMNAEGIDHTAHMGGFTSGMILAIMLLLVMPNNRIQRRGSE